MKKILIGILVIGIGITLYQFILKTDKTDVVSNETSRNQSIPKGSEVAEFRTYRNKKYGFEFRYPASWGNVIINIESVFPDDYDPENFYKFADSPEYDPKNLRSHKIIQFGFDNRETFSPTFEIQEYTDAYPLGVDCEGGPCWMINLAAERKDIESKSNLVIGGQGARMYENKSEISLIRIYTVFTTKYRFEVGAVYPLLKQSAPDPKQLSDEKEFISSIKFFRLLTETEKQFLSRPEVVACTTNNDCKAIILECGYCSNNSHAINKQYLEEAIRIHVGACRGNERFCDAMPNNHAECINNTCTLIKD